MPVKKNIRTNNSCLLKYLKFFFYMLKKCSFKIKKGERKNDFKIQNSNAY